MGQIVYMRDSIGSCLYFNYFLFEQNKSNIFLSPKIRIVDKQPPHPTSYDPSRIKKKVLLRLHNVQSH